jgi:hypothetical protein
MSETGFENSLKTVRNNPQNEGISLDAFKRDATG